MALVMLMLKNPDSTRWGEMGARGFSGLPRVGEHIEARVDGKGYLYKVMAVEHPSRPSATVPIQSECS